MEEEEEEAISRILSELEESRHHSLSPPISDSSLSDLHSLTSSAHGGDVDGDGGGGVSHPIHRLYDELSTKSLSPSSLVGALSSAMDSGAPSHAVTASKVYLALILCPNSPVFTLFTPMAFLSLLRSVRRYLKNRPEASSGGAERNPAVLGGRKRKKNRRVENEAEADESEFDVRVLFSVMENLELAVELIHLDRFPDSLKTLIQTVTEIPAMAIEVCPNPSSYSRLIGFCSKILIQVLRPEHGEEANTASEIFKCLSPAILRPKSQARTFALEFVTIKIANAAKRSEGVDKAMVNLPKYLVSKAPEKSEARALAVESIMEIVRVLESDDQVRFVEHVLKMTRGKSTLRLLATDLIPTLITSLRDPLGLESETENENESETRDSWGVKCLEALIHRCSDSVAGIRARALSNLSHIAGFLCGDSRSREVLKEVTEIRNVEEGSVNVLLRERCADEKAAVRKSALLLVAKLTALFGSGFHGGLLKTMGMSCSDPLVSIRKAAIQALSEAFRKSSDESVTTEWLHSIPRLISDNETSIQEECENLFLELVLERICKSGSTRSTLDEESFEAEFDSVLPEGVLGLLKAICDGEVTPWVRKICTSLGKKNKLKPKFSKALQDIIKTSESLWVKHRMAIEKWTAPPGAWFLLSEVSGFLAKSVDWKFLTHHWQLLDKDGNSKGVSFLEEEDIESNSVSWAGDRVFLLQTISNVSLELPPEPAAELAHNLYQRLDAFNMHSTEVKAHVKALKTLCKQKASSQEEAETLVAKWLDQLLYKASGILEKFISDSSEENRRQSFSTPLRSGTKKKTRPNSMARSLPRAITAVYTIGSLVIHYPSADMTAIVPLLHTIVTSGNSDPKLSKLPGAGSSFVKTAPSLYIHAWLALGKICLADEKLAKRYIPIFVQELQNSDSAALRNNLVVIMADFCIHHTALVDCHINKITKCLRDPCELVRRQTFTLLSRLLQRDYVKWRGVLFLRFLLSLVDESEKIKQLADFLFGNILKVKAPLLAYNSFIEAIFVLNDCHVHSGHSDSRGSRSENRLFSIRGNDERARSKRMHIYVSLLKQMAPEHLLATFAKLCAEILAAASDGALNIDDITGKSVLQDTFQILSCKEIRLPSNRGPSSSSDPADIIDEESNGQGSSSASRGRAITQAVKKGLIQNTIPIFIELKRLLEGKNSPLVGPLMECLRVLLKDYKSEIDDILVADKQLQRELLYDMSKFENAKSASLPSNAKSARSPAGNADVAAEATVRSVLKEVESGILSPPLSSGKLPKLKTPGGGGGGTGVNATSSSRVDRRTEVLESLRRRPNFDSDGEN